MFILRNKKVITIFMLKTYAYQDYSYFYTDLSKTVLPVRFVFVMLYSFLSVPGNLVTTCLERADILTIVCDVFLRICHFPIWCPGSGVVFDCINSRYLPSSLLL